MVLSEVSLKGTKIALVFLDYTGLKNIAFTSEYLCHIGTIPPISLLYTAAALERHGCNVLIIDGAANHYADKKIVEILEEYSPDYVGYTLTTVNLHDWYRSIRFIKRHIKRPVIVGGVHMSCYPAETMDNEDIDYGIIGESEETLPELIHHLNKKKDVSHVKGIIYRHSKKVEITSGRAAPDINKIPFMARHLIDNRKYYSLISRRKNWSVMTTIRGCGFKCSYCPEKDYHPFRIMDAKRVVDEMEDASKRFGINEFDFWDSVFTVSRKRVLDICNEIKARELKVSWAIRTRPDAVNEEVICALASAGCYRIMYGLDTSSEYVHKKINRNLRMESVRKAVALSKKYRINTFLFLVFGLPYETRESIEDTIRFTISLDVDHIQVNQLLYSPHTPLYKEVVEYTGYDYWRDYTLTGKMKKSFPSYKTGLTQKEIRYYQKKAYLSFYIRPRYLLSFIKIRNIAETTKFMKAGFAFLYSYAKEGLAKLFCSG